MTPAVADERSIPLRARARPALRAAIRFLDKRVPVDADGKPVQPKRILITRTARLARVRVSFESGAKPPASDSQPSSPIGIGAGANKRAAFSDGRLLHRRKHSRRRKRHARKMERQRKAAQKGGRAKAAPIRGADGSGQSHLIERVGLSFADTPNPSPLASASPPRRFSATSPPSPDSAPDAEPSSRRPSVARTLSSPRCSCSPTRARSFACPTADGADAAQASATIDASMPLVHGLGNVMFDAGELRPRWLAAAETARQSAASSVLGMSFDGSKKGTRVISPSTTPSAGSWTRTGVPRRQWERGMTASAMFDCRFGDQKALVT